VILFSALRAEVSHKLLYMWLLSIVVSTVYSYSWDVLKDWGLGERGAKLLRKKLIYKIPLVYYAVMISNFIMRFMWTLTISPESTGIVMNPTAFSAILAAVEIVRRSIWNIFRLENEQLNNTEHFRAVSVVVPPMQQRHDVGHKFVKWLKSLATELKSEDDPMSFNPWVDGEESSFTSTNWVN